MATSFNLTVITLEQAINDSKREYNPTSWKQACNSYTFHENTRFYKDMESGKIYASYTIEEGLPFFKEVQYSSCLSNAGFAKVLIFDMPDGGIYVSVLGFVINGEPNQRAANNKSNRKELVKMAAVDKCLFFSNEF